MTDSPDLWTPDVATLKEQARAAAARAKYADPTGYRRQAGMVTLPQLADAPKCAGCGGTLAQDEHERHPGCLAVRDDPRATLQPEQETPT
jgi:hypothetical protein